MISPEITSGSVVVMIQMIDGCVWNRSAPIRRHWKTDQYGYTLNKYEKM
jgi:hypothetical protein